jgi:hypothetical protein
LDQFGDKCRIVFSIAGLSQATTCWHEGASEQDPSLSTTNGGRTVNVRSEIADYQAGGGDAAIRACEKGQQWHLLSQQYCGARHAPRDAPTIQASFHRLSLVVTARRAQDASLR